MVIPRSRSRSIESSSCSRMSREATVWVISRMRSARVDFPWSMWAMIEKLRMRLWSDKRPPRIEGGPRAPGSGRVSGGGRAAEPAGDQAAQLLGLGQLHREDDRGVGDRGRREPAADGEDLTDEAASEDPVERDPP